MLVDASGVIFEILVKRVPGFQCKNRFQGLALSFGTANFVLF